MICVNFNKDSLTWSLDPIISMDGGGSTLVRFCCFKSLNCPLPDSGAQLSYIFYWVGWYFFSYWKSHHCSVIGLCPWADPVNMFINDIDSVLDVGVGSKHAYLQITFACLFSWSYTLIKTKQPKNIKFMHSEKIAPLKTKPIIMSLVFVGAILYESIILMFFACFVLIRV